MTRTKGTPSHYRQRIDRLRRRAAYLRQELAYERVNGSVAALHHARAEASALEWAVSILTPWFAKEERDDEAHPDADSAEILSSERSTSVGPRDKAFSSSDSCGLITALRQDPRSAQETKDDPRNRPSVARSDSGPRDRTASKCARNSVKNDEPV